MPSRSKSTVTNGSSSQATSGVWESGLSVGSVRPYIRNDLKHHETCTFGRLLQVFLARCRSSPGTDENNLPTVPSTPIVPPGFTDPSNDGSPDSIKTEKPEPRPSATPIIPSQPQPHPNPTTHVDDEELVQICLDAVLPICNESRFRELLGQFRDADGHEKDRYGPFVELFNYALQRLSELPIPHLRARSDSNILLHVSDPKQITGYNNSTRVPDINIVSLTAAKRANPTTAGNHTQWADFALGCANGQPERAFSWPEVLGAFEFKREKKIQTDIPEEYTNSSPVPLPHHRLDALDLASVSGASDASQSASTRSDLSESGSASNNASRPGTHTDAKASEFKAPDYRGHDLAPSPLPGSHEPKRRRDVPDPEKLGERSTRKRARQEAPSNENIKEAMVQCAVYASEMLSGSIARTHAINLLVIDEVARVWWYDRQGTIQSQGINFIRDAPHFLALLLAFQRFTLADWGFSPELTPSTLHLPSDVQTPSAESQDRLNVRVDSHNISIDPRDIIYQAYSLLGRGTGVFGATSDSPELAGVPLVVKIYWPNVDRLNEVDIVRDAVNRVPQAKSYLPKVFGSCDLSSTKTIRDELGFYLNSKGTSRVCRIVVFERLEPIIKLKGEALLTAWIQCVRCHYLVWEAGIHHRDLSVGNLMVRTIDGEKFGVVNDWDLSYVVDKSPEPDEHTATMPFLSLDLLDGSYWTDHKVEYRHDLESFFWILLWVVMCLEHRSNGDKWTIPEGLRPWQTGNPTECHARKSRLLTQPNLFKARPEWQNIGAVAAYLLVLLSRDQHGRLAARLIGINLQPKEPNSELLREFLGEVQNGVPDGYNLPRNPEVCDVDTIE